MKKTLVLLFVLLLLVPALAFADVIVGIFPLRPSLLLYVIFLFK